MKVLLDTCIWGGARESLQAGGHEVEWVGQWKQDPGDEEILAFAYQNGYVLVTLDKDFGELAVALGRPHRGIVRLVNLPARRQGPVCAYILQKHADDLSRGAIITATAERIRVRLPG